MGIYNVLKKSIKLLKKILFQILVLNGKMNLIIA